MRVRELVGGNVTWVKPNSTLRQAAVEMGSAVVGSVAVEVDGALEGILTALGDHRPVGLTHGPNH